MGIWQISKQRRKSPGIVKHVSYSIEIGVLCHSGCLSLVQKPSFPKDQVEQNQAELFPDQKPGHQNKVEHIMYAKYIFRGIGRGRWTVRMVGIERPWSWDESLCSRSPRISTTGMPYAFIPFDLLPRCSVELPEVFHPQKWQTIGLMKSFSQILPHWGRLNYPVGTPNFYHIAYSTLK